MTATVGHADLPRTTSTPVPATGLLRRGRPMAQRIIRTRFRIEIVGAEHVPPTGPVVIAANHTGVIDGPLLAIMTPRPVHALTKVEMFEGRTGRFLTAAGQIPLQRHVADVAAIRSTLRVLRDGGVVGVFPEGARGAGEIDVAEGGAAYLALATGATVVPLAFLGTREPGGSLNSMPPRGSRVVMTFGEPIGFEGHGWPRRPVEVREATHRIRNGMLDTLRSAVAATGIGLPGPVPGGHSDDESVALAISMIEPDAGTGARISPGISPGTNPETSPETSPDISTEEDPT
jgi:1-acyl-sn-glycerol-3-phosphate acyltransferase